MIYVLGWKLQLNRTVFRSHLATSRDFALHEPQFLIPKMGTMIEAISQVLVKVKWDKACQILSKMPRTWAWSRLAMTGASLGTLGSNLCSFFAWLVRPTPFHQMCLAPLLLPLWKYSCYQKEPCDSALAMDFCFLDGVGRDTGPHDQMWEAGLLNGKGLRSPKDQVSRWSPVIGVYTESYKVKLTDSYEILALGSKCQLRK